MNGARYEFLWLPIAIMYALASVGFLAGAAIGVETVTGIVLAVVSGTICIVASALQLFVIWSNRIVE